MIFCSVGLLLHCLLQCHARLHFVLNCTVAQVAAGVCIMFFLQLWHRSNWHWYLKHEQLFLLPDSAGMLTVAWDDLRSLRLHLMMGSGSYTIMDYDWGVAVSGRGTAAVIDGHQLLITPLR